MLILFSTQPIEQFENRKFALFINAVPEYSWKMTEIEVNVSVRETSLQLEVTVMRSSLTNSDHEVCSRACPNESFRLLNDSKSRWVYTNYLHCLLIDTAISSISDVLMMFNTLYYNCYTLNRAILF